jgi:hypothetical protein
MDEVRKSQIDAMSLYEMAQVWRFAPLGDLRLRGEEGAYFQTRFYEMGGMTPQISKLIGWGD